MFKNIVKLVTVFALYIGAFSVTYADNFQEFPATNNLCGLGLYLDPVADGYTGQRRCVSSVTYGTSTLLYWNFVTATSTGNYYINFSPNHMEYTGRYIHLVNELGTGVTPRCPTYARDKDLNTIATVTWYAGGYVNYLGGGDKYVMICNYDLGTTRSSEGLNFSPYSINNFMTTGKLYGVYSDDNSNPNYGSDPAPYLYTLQQSVASSTNTNTRIVDFTPADGSILASSTPVNFTLQVYVNPEDVSSTYGVGVRIRLHNIDQNTLLSDFSSNDIVLVSENATNGGYYSYSTSTTLAVGNYRVEASISKTYAFGIVTNILSSVNQSQSHQFIVGTSTFIGAISQSSYRQMNSILSTFQATSTESLAGSCNPINGWDTTRCISYLFIPDSEQVKTTMDSFRNTMLYKFPVGYVTRIYDIFSMGSTSTLPSMTLHIPTGASSSEALNFNMQDMVTGGANTLSNINSPINHKTAREVFEPFVKLMVALAVLFTILEDITGMFSHTHGEVKKGKYNKYQNIKT